MGWWNVGIAAGGLISNISANKKAGDAAESAAGIQGDAAMAGIEQQKAQFQAIQKLLQPYVTAGTGALTGQQDLIGLNGADAQAKAIAAIEQSPAMAALTKQGETALLQNASATGGLRGGNTQGALAEFRPALLAQLIEQQYGKLGGLTSIGQNAAAGVGNAGISTGNSITDLLQQQGAAAAGGALAQGRMYAGYGNAISGAIGTYAGLGGFRGGSSGPTITTTYPGGC